MNTHTHYGGFVLHPDILGVGQMSSGTGSTRVIIPAQAEGAVAFSKRMHKEYDALLEQRDSYGRRKCNWRMWQGFEDACKDGNGVVENEKSVTGWRAKMSNLDDATGYGIEYLKNAAKAPGGWLATIFPTGEATHEAQFQSGRKIAGLIADSGDEDVQKIVCKYLLGKVFGRTEIVSRTVSTTEKIIEQRTAFIGFYVMLLKKNKIFAPELFTDAASWTLKAEIRETFIYRGVIACTVPVEQTVVKTHTVSVNTGQPKAGISRI